MMIQDYYGLCPAQKLRTFRIARLVGVYHNYDSILVCQLHGSGTVYKHVLLILRILHIACNQRTDRGRRIVDDNLCLLAKRLAGPIHTNGRPQGIDICNLVSHTEDSVLGRKKFLQCLCLHPRLDPGIFLRLKRLSAPIGNGLAVLYGSLVSSPAKSHLHGYSGIFIILAERNAVQSDPDTDSQCHTVPDIDAFDILQNLKPILFQPFQGGILQHQEVFVLFQLSHDPVKIRKVFSHATVNQSDQQGTPDLLHAFQCLFIIVQIGQAYNKFFILVFILYLTELGLVIQADALKERVLSNVFKNLCRQLQAVYGYPPDLKPKQSVLNLNQVIILLFFRDVSNLFLFCLFLG